MGTNHLSVGYESSQLWVRIVWVRNVRGYETSGKQAAEAFTSSQKEVKPPKSVSKLLVLLSQN